jgi:hypothetical protein
MAPAEVRRARSRCRDRHPTGSANGTSLDDARLDTLFAGPDRPSDALVHYSKDTPPETRNAVIERAQAAGCRVSIARY